MPEFVAQAQIIWSIRSDQEVSEACLHADEFMLSAARTCRLVQSIMHRMRRGEGKKDADLMTALKKYVEDTCEAIKQVDNELKGNAWPPAYTMSHQDIEDWTRKWSQAPSRDVCKT